MDVASLVLSACALYSGCKVAFNSIVSARCFPEGRESLRRKLKVQQLRLITWGEAYGVAGNLQDHSTASQHINATALHTRPALELVVEILGKVQTLISDAEKLLAKYGLEKRPTSRPTPRGGLFKWVLYEREDLEQLINDLDYFNNGLHSTLTPLVRSTVEWVVAAKLPGETEDVSQLRVIQEISQNNIALRDIACIREFNFQAASPTQKFASELEMPLSALQASPNREVLRSPRELRQIHTDHSSVAEEYVLVEWKSLDSHESSHTAYEQILLRARRLAQLLAHSYKPSDFRTLSCIGYILDQLQCRLGMVFELPPPNPSAICSWQARLRSNEDLHVPSWTTLHDLIQTRTKVPTLEHRFSLATALLKSMIQWHATGWFHKAFSSSNVLHFWETNEQSDEPAEISPAFVDIRQPMIVGFNFSRPSSVVEISDSYSYDEQCHPAYIHPEYFQSAKAQPIEPKKKIALRFEASFDMFSLGCVLLEIGLWRTLTSLWNDPKDPIRWVDRLRHKYVPELGRGAA